MFGTRNDTQAIPDWRKEKVEKFLNSHFSTEVKSRIAYVSFIGSFLHGDWELTSDIDIMIVTHPRRYPITDYFIQGFDEPMPIERDSGIIGDIDYELIDIIGYMNNMKKGGQKAIESYYADDDAILLESEKFNRIRNCSYNKANVISRKMYDGYMRTAQKHIKKHEYLRALKNAYIIKNMIEYNRVGITQEESETIHNCRWSNDFSASQKKAIEVFAEIEELDRSRGVELHIRFSDDILKTKDYIYRRMITDFLGKTE